MITGLLVPGCTLPATGALRLATALGVFSWLQITHINLRFVFLLCAHITFLSLLVVFLVLGCVSRAEIFAAAYNLLVWDQVVQTGSAYLSNASAVELHAPQNLRPSFPSTNSRTPYYHYLCHEFLAPISSAICSF